jgi:hypothetical protein
LRIRSGLARIGASTKRVSSIPQYAPARLGSANTAYIEFQPLPAAAMLYVRIGIVVSKASNSDAVCCTVGYSTGKCRLRFAVWK